MALGLNKFPQITPSVLVLTRTVLLFFFLYFISDYFGVVYRVILPPGVGFYTRFMQVDVWTQSDSIFTTLASPDQDLNPQNKVASLLHTQMNKF